MKRRSQISIVIPTKNRFDDLCRAIDSILRQTISPNEIVIIDSSDNADLSSMLRSKFPSATPTIKYVHIKVPLTTARNLGIRHTSNYDVLFFFDDDVILDRYYIKEVVDVFAKDLKGNIGGVMGNIINLPRDTTSITAKIRKLFFLAHFGDGKFLPSGLPTYAQGQKTAMQVEFLSGCMLAFSRRVLNEFAFDESLGRLSGYCYLEDADMSYRVSRRFRLKYTPFARLEHYPSTGRVDRVLVTKQLVVNHQYLFRKNMPKELSTMIAFSLSLLGILLVHGLLSRSSEGILGWLQGVLSVTRIGLPHLLG